MIYISKIDDTSLWHYRVLLTKEEDWSGCADSMEEAWQKAARLYRDIGPAFGY